MIRTPDKIKCKDIKKIYTKTTQYSKQKNWTWLNLPPYMFFFYILTPVLCLFKVKLGSLRVKKCHGGLEPPGVASNKHKQKRSKNVSY